MADAETRTLKFHYIKSPLCRDIHVNGIIGGINPVSGELQFSAFSERPPIPKALAFEWSEDGSLGRETERESRDGVVRVVQDTLYMDFSVALALRKWLNDHVEAFLKANPSIEIKP